MPVVSRYSSVPSKLKSAATPVIAALCFFVVGAFIAQSVYQRHVKEEKIAATVVCTARTTYLFQNMKADVLLEFMAHPAQQTGTGIVSVSGNFYQDKKISGTLRRKIPFTWSGTLDYVQLRSGTVMKSKIDDTVPDDLLEQVLPDFYVFSNKSIDYTISREGKTGWLFIIGQSPKFLCEETPNT
jgi:hypothetical protein